MNQGFFSDEVLTQVRGSLGVVTLNRPHALNALNIDMIRQVCGTLRTWEKEPAVQAVLFLGAGERAFCAGGDLKGFYRAGMDYRRGALSQKASCMFFAEEYNLDSQIFHYPKPTLAFMDGIVMGGGYGIGGNCAHRIVTGKTLFAMPETGIGFFPDVGSVFHLLKAPNNFGRYMALTGTHVGAADVLAAGLAEYYVEAARREELVAALSKTTDVKKTLTEFNTKPQDKGLLEKNTDRINHIFSKEKVPDLLKALGEDGSPFALETLALIESRSPSSVLVTAEHLRRCKGKSFDDVIAGDFILAQRFPERADFYEGIRAAVIDKDRKPLWDPKELDAVTREDVESYFTPTGHNLRDVRVFAA